MKYRERPTDRNLKKRRYDFEDLVEINTERFDLFCDTFGGLENVSHTIGRSRDYLRKCLYNYKNMIPFRFYIVLCDTYKIPDKFLMGYGETRDFRRWLNRNKPKEKKEKHAVCDEYCKGCMYSSKFSSLTMPVELGCDYMFVTGERRGCPAGTGCNKKTVGVNRQRPLTILY